MNKAVISVVAAAVAAFAVPAQAAETIALVPSGGTLTGAYAKAGVGLGSFTHEYTFTLPSAGSTSASLVTVALSAVQNIDFTSATLNGNALTLLPTGVFEGGSIITSTVAGLQTLTINGVSGGNASYSGTVNFIPAAGGVPEPATWGMLILGFGAIGAAMRRRNALSATTTRVAFN